MFAPGGPRAAGQLPQHISPRRPQRLPCPDAAAHQAGPSPPVEGQDLHLCILVAGTSSGHLCQLKISSSFFFPTLPGTHHTGLCSSSPRKTQDRTLVSGQDGGPVAACSPTLVGPSKHLLRGLRHMGEGNKGGIQRGVVYISKTLWLVLGGG